MKVSFFGKLVVGTLVCVTVGGGVVTSLGKMGVTAQNTTGKLNDLSNSGFVPVPQLVSSQTNMSQIEDQVVSVEKKEEQKSATSIVGGASIGATIGAFGGIILYFLSNVDCYEDSFPYSTLASFIISLGLIGCGAGRLIEKIGRRQSQKVVDEHIEIDKLQTDLQKKETSLPHIGGVGKESVSPNTDQDNQAENVKGPWRNLLNWPCENQRGLLSWMFSGILNGILMGIKCCNFSDLSFRELLSFRWLFLEIKKDHIIIEVLAKGFIGALTGKLMERFGIDGIEAGMETKMRKHMNSEGLCKIAPKIIGFFLNNFIDRLAKKTGKIVIKTVESPMLDIELITVENQILYLGLIIEAAVYSALSSLV